MALNYDAKERDGPYDALFDGFDYDNDTPTVPGLKRLQESQPAIDIRRLFHEYQKDFENARNDMERNAAIYGMIHKAYSDDEWEVLSEYLTEARAMYLLRRIYRFDDWKRVAEMHPQKSRWWNIAIGEMIELAKTKEEIDTTFVYQLETQHAA